MAKLETIKRMIGAPETSNETRSARTRLDHYFNIIGRRAIRDMTNGQFSQMRRKNGGETRRAQKLLPSLYPDETGAYHSIYERFG